MSILNPFADQVRAFSDEEVVAAYERTNGEPDNKEAEMLLAEIERRGLDV